MKITGESKRAVIVEMAGKDENSLNVIRRVTETK